MLKRSISRREADRVRALPTLEQSQADDLKAQNHNRRLWVSRVELDSDNLPLVSREALQANGSWQVVATS